MVRSAFMGTFGEEAMKWLSLLTAPQYDYIVAIARKCPRLIDVILRESKTFSPSIWDKVITEHALPFHFAQMPPKHNYLLIDDSVFYGSTFKKIETLIKNLNNISQSENANECNKINIKNATLFLLENNRLENLNINMYFQVLSNIKSPSGKQTLDFGEFDGKEITGVGYKITFQFTSHWE